MSADPFVITGPAVISFSGGRSSAYMLRRILDAHGGTLPDDVVVCFANTGREMPATLDFVAECAAAWNVRVHWLEYRWEPGRHYTVEVSHNSASRAGEPFEYLFQARSALPNPVARFCTIDLKLRTQARFLRDLGWDYWTSAVGLRADEPRRVGRSIIHSGKRKDRWSNVHPLADAGVTVTDVLRFWRTQPFDLRLAGSWEGNCDGCFLKSRGAIMRMMQDHPERMKWWPDQEATPRNCGNGNTFRIDRSSYAYMAVEARDQPRIEFGMIEQALPCTGGGCGV